MVLRLVMAIAAALCLGGCHVLTTARSTLADVAPPPPPGPLGKPVCPGPEVDGECEATSLHGTHPASGPVRAKPGDRCPPTVLGVPGWCARF